MQMDQIDQMDQMDNVGAPVFALMGYAVASHVIPGGVLYRCVVWLGAKCAGGVCKAT